MSQLGVFKDASQDRLQLIGLLDGDEVRREGHDSGQFSESDIDAEDYFNLLLSPARPRRIRHSQGLAAVVLPPVQEGGRDNLEGKLDRRGRHDVFGAR
ncbi:uncharacterized protein HRG_08937 [Hirsutella rhossiliensis]|uniref:Uncharacterized protein n=1 Tax=Hirsutella rhossiliensis TaxID=111463 RepID=A0A9P8SGE7_9HYPO|nr:uncharacterized protein HRG_08937 [Hirsutella rhossiliensis]KAH0959916.1 hypothetical protein HRG_08937 [Hirsutella rhossiliensis]